MVRPAVAVGQEPIRVDRAFGAVQVARGERRERDRPTLTLGPRLGDVREDPEQPGLERRASFEAADAGERAEPGLLHDLLGNRAVAHEQHRHPEHRRAVRPDERQEDRFVARLEALDDQRLVRPRSLFQHDLGVGHPNQPTPVSPKV
jgi:hypothetical protein